MALIKMLYKYFYKKLKKQVGYVVYDGVNYHQPLEDGSYGCLSECIPYNMPFIDSIKEYEEKLIRDMDIKVKYLCTRCKAEHETQSTIVEGFGCSKCLGGDKDGE